jgi:hypothetical protein
MRMWMVDPKILCRKHLMGEHVELHMFVGTFKKKKNITGYIRNNLLEICSIINRHQMLAEEMTRRGYNHQSDLDFNLDMVGYCQPEHIKYKVDSCSALADLISRCSICKERYMEIQNGNTM